MLNTIINDRYHIDAEIGQGGMGIVFRARDSILNRNVAVKQLSNFKLGTEGKARLLGEAQTVAQLNHPNIAAVYDAGEHDGLPFIVMELVEGPTLRAEPPASWDDIITVLRQICAALQHAHDHAVVHRDLKPENVILHPDGTLKLMDFGIAHSASSRITTDGMVVGTVHYMSPEQAMGKSVDARSDLYSLGVMLYEFATGTPPFEDFDPIAVISQHINAPIVPPRAKRNDIPPGLDALIMRLLEKDPEDRPASVGDVLKIIDDPLFLDTGAFPVIELSMLDRIVRGRMVGRRPEIEQARLLWKETTLGTGQTLLISGEPGIGKTRLVREIVTHADVTGGQAFIGESYAEGGVPYDAFTQIVRKVLQRHKGEELDLPDFVLADLIELSPELKPYYPSIQPNPPLNPEAHQRRLFENMVTFCTRISQLAPLLLVIDDAHWSDSGTLHMLRHLMRRTRNLPIMLVATYREVELDEALPFHEVMLDLNRERLGARIKLSRLKPEEANQLLEVIFNDEITPEFLEGVYKETEGNPFFIEEVCKALIESGKVFYDQDGGWDRVDIHELEIPQGVKVAIQYRVSKLPETSKDAMVAAAVIGREFDFSTLLQVVESDEESLITAIEGAAKAQLIDELRHKSGEHFSFSHALIPAALRETLGGLRRSRLHRRVASAIHELHPDDFERIAYHYSEAGDEERGLEFTIKAARRARESYANEEAVRFFTEALGVVPKDDPERFALLKGRADACNQLARRAEQEADLDEMLSLADRLDDDGLRVDALNSLADFSMRADKLDDLSRYAQRAVQIAETLDDPVRLAEAYLELAKTYSFTGEHSKRVELLSKAIAVFESSSMPAEAASTKIMQSFSLMNLDQKEAAFQAAQDALALGRQVGDPFTEAVGLEAVSAIQFTQAEYRQSLSNLEQAHAFFHRTGSRQRLAYNHYYLAFVHRVLGEQEQNLSHLESALNVAWEIDEPSIFFQVLRDLSLYRYVFSGEIERGLEYLSKQIAKAEQIGLPNLANMARFALSIYQLHIGDYSSAAQMIDRVRSEDVLTAELLGWIYELLLAWCQIGIGEYDRALSSAQHIYEHKIQVTQDLGTIADMLGTLAWAGLMHGDASKYPAALEHAAAAVEYYERITPSALGRLGVTVALDAAARLNLALDHPGDALVASKKLAGMVEIEILSITAPYLYTHSLVLRASGQEQEADAYLQNAYDRVASVAENIKDPQIRSTWLESHRQNREIVLAYEASPLAPSG